MGGSMQHGMQSMEKCIAWRATVPKEAWLGHTNAVKQARQVLEGATWAYNAVRGVSQHACSASWRCSTSSHLRATSRHGSSPAHGDPRGAAKPSFRIACARTNYFNLQQLQGKQ